MIVDQRGKFTLSRGPRPESYDDFRALNAVTVINLEMGFFEFFHNRCHEEDQWGKAYGNTVIHIPCSDFTPPSNEQIKLFIGLVTTALVKGNVYFHCLYGVDRTGFMAAVYRIIIQGWDVQKAVEEMLNLGFHKFPYFYWIPRIERED